MRRCLAANPVVSGRAGLTSHSRAAMTAGISQMTGIKRRSRGRRPLTTAKKPRTGSPERVPVMSELITDLVGDRFQLSKPAGPGAPRGPDPTRRGRRDVGQLMNLLVLAVVYVEMVQRH